MFKYKICISLLLFSIYSSVAINEASKDSWHQFNVVLLVFFALLMFVLPWIFNIRKKLRFAIGAFVLVILQLGLGIPLLLVTFLGEPSVTSIFNIGHLLTGSLLSEVLCVMLAIATGILLALLFPVITFKNQQGILNSSQFNGKKEYRLFKIILFSALTISGLRYFTGAAEAGAADGSLILSLLNILGTGCSSLIVFSAAMAVSQSNDHLGPRAFGFAVVFSIFNFVLFLSKLFIFTLILASIFYHVTFGFSRGAKRIMIPLAIIGTAMYPFANILREIYSKDSELSLFNLIAPLEWHLGGEFGFLAFLGYALNSALSRIGLLQPLVHTIENFGSKSEIYDMAGTVGGGSVAANIAYVFFGIDYPFGYSLGYFGGTYLLIGFTGVMITSFLIPYMMLFLASLLGGRATATRTYLTSYFFFYLSFFFLNGPVVNWMYEVFNLAIGLAVAVLINLKFRLR